MAFIVKMDDMLNALKRVKHAISDDQTRFYLCGVLIEKTVDGAALTAADGRRLCSVAVQGEGEMPSTIVPSKTIDALVAAFGKCKQRHGALVTVDVNRIAWLSEIVDYVPIDGTFPDWHRIVSDTWNHTISVNQEILLRAVKAIDGFNRAWEQTGAHLLFADGKLTITARCEGGEVRVAVDAEGINEPIEIGFDSRYLLDWAKHCDWPLVTFGIVDSFSAARLISARAETYVLMPMRI